jgi:membrane-associated protease RseP (regulator of RpoE activity)
LLAPFIVCPILYWVLIQWGRLPRPAAKPPAEGPPIAEADKRPTLRPIDKQEEAILQNCFPWSVYYLQNIEYRPQALICRGQLRTSPEVAYTTIRENVEAHFGDRFLIVFQEGLSGKPFFALVPNPHLQTVSHKAASEPITRPGLALVLLLATLITTTQAGTVILGIADKDLGSNLSHWLAGLPYAIALMAILGVHELAHYLTARWHAIRVTLPYFIPIPPAGFFPFGTFGAFIQMRSPIPSRKVLFDVGIAGPLAGFIIAVPLFWWGLAHSQVIPANENSGIFNYASLQPNLLLPALLSKLTLGSKLTAAMAIKLHPVAVAGYLGLIITAINLTPVGQLDGGHIVHAMFGQRVGALIGQISRLLVLALSFIHQEFLLWAILLFFIPVVDEPALNDVSELDNRRDLLGLLALGLLLIIILPAPKAIIQVLF